MRLTPITLNDLYTLRDLAMRTYSAAFASKNAPGVIERYYEDAFAKAHLKKQLSNPDSYWYFHKDQEEILGYLKLNTGNAQTEFQEENGLEVERIYIDIPYLGKRYGSELIEFSISKAKELEKNYIWLGVWEENPEAIKFYKRHGFKIVGTHDYDMIAEIQTDYIMRLNL